MGVQVILNHKDTSVKLGENEFSDQCWIEFAGSKLLTNNNGICYKSPIPAYDPPVDESQDVDWVSKGAVTPVKNQGSCLMLVVLRDWCHGGCTLEGHGKVDLFL